MKEPLIHHERRMLVLAYLKARTEGDLAGAEEIRAHATEDPELGLLLDLEDDEAARRAAQTSRFVGLVASTISRALAVFGCHR